MTSVGERPGTILLTGASRGIGLAIAQHLVATGWPLVAVSRTCSAELDAVLAAASQPAHFVAADLSDTDAIPELVGSIEREHGPLYGLVNNAGAGLDGLLLTQHSSDISKLIELNLLAPIMLCKYVARQLVRRRRGRIVNITSIVAQNGFSGLAVYSATKAGLEALTRSLAREVGRAKVTVNAVAPGFIETEMTAGLGESQLDSIERRSPLGLAIPQDVAGAVAYLLADEALRVTGSVVTVDGGSTA